ncbi:MAG: UbiX family flavin prenyltransferase [Treponema sp.]|jgi:4-hydroxy-3-polyprenylbenzoate decarboxylase|nr:UbiX family flavin prenyltransferase [Treponema sp.]
MKRYLVCITGASGALYGIRTLQALHEAGGEVHVVASSWGKIVIEEETKKTFSEWMRLLDINPDHIYSPENLAAAPSSGSNRFDGTVVVPCSMNSVGCIASGISGNLVHRAALVALKESRPLILVPREMPLSVIDLKNLTCLAEAGAAILPASPAFYHSPTSIDELVDFVVGKILDRLEINHNLFKRWMES